MFSGSVPLTSIVIPSPEDDVELTLFKSVLQLFIRKPSVVFSIPVWRITDFFDFPAYNVKKQAFNELGIAPIYDCNQKHKIKNIFLNTKWKHF